MVNRESSMAREENNPTDSEFIDNVRERLDDAEKLLREAAETSGDKAAELRENALQSLRRTREALYETQDAVLRKGREAARVTDDYVHDNPWQSVAVAGVTGLLVGMLISRR
jgi:ElaB/YqjD/DUF883 family membrane-anchored ribosome-binding protein